MTSTVIFAAASATEHPLIDIDWTAFLQFGIFALTALIASRWLFRPYLDMRDRRSAGIEGARADATRMSAEADAKLTGYEQSLATARTRANEERRQVRAEAATHQREVTERARAEAVSAYDEAKRRVASETDKARGELLPKSQQLARDIATRLLGRKVSS